MKALAAALVMSTLLTVDQRDAYRSELDTPASAVSADGRYVAFVTFARLADADSDGAADVYVLDRVRQQVTFESTAVTIDTFHPDISADGRYVVFESDGALVWRDRQENVTRVIGPGHRPSIADAGAVVVFQLGRDVHALDPRTGEARRVSLELTGLDAASASSVAPSVSADGRYIAFSAREALANGNKPKPHLFVRDMQRHVTRRIGHGWAPSISGDGRYLAFAGQEDGLSHIFLADLQTGATELITRSAHRGRANGASANPAISADGSVIVFQSQASDLVAGEDFNLLWDVFKYDRSSRSITRVSGDQDGVWMASSVGPSLDGSGSVIAFSSRHPTGAADKRNDFDLYVATMPEAVRQASVRLAPADHR